MVGLEIDGYISKRGKRKSASYFVKKKFIDCRSNGKDEGSNNGISLRQRVPFSSDQTIENASKGIENIENTELKNIQKNIPLLNHHDTPRPRDRQGKIKNARLNESTYCLDKFL